MKKSIKKIETKAIKAKNVKAVKGGEGNSFDYRGYGQSSSFEIDNNMY